MGLIKKIASGVGKVAGSVVGGTVELIGEATDSNLIKDIGKSVYRTSVRSGNILGDIVEGGVNTVSGIVKDDKQLRNNGAQQMFDAGVETVSGVANGIVGVTKKGVDTVGAIIEGDTEKIKECGKEFIKIAAVSALTIGVIEVFDTIVDLDIDDIDDNDMVEIENENLHDVTPHWRDLGDGRKIWVDGDGDTAVDTFEGWTQHNPNYRTTL